MRALAVAAEPGTSRRSGHPSTKSVDGGQAIARAGHTRTCGWGRTMRFPGRHRPESAAGANRSAHPWGWDAQAVGLTTTSRAKFRATHRGGGRPRPALVLDAPPCLHHGRVSREALRGHVDRRLRQWCRALLASEHRQAVGMTRTSTRPRKTPVWRRSSRHGDLVQVLTVPGRPERGDEVFVRHTCRGADWFDQVNHSRRCLCRGLCGCGAGVAGGSRRRAVTALRCTCSWTVRAGRRVQVCRPGRGLS